MARKHFPLFGFVLAVFGILVASQPNVLAGPPLICFPFDIGDAKSLPWDSGRNWNAPKGGYNVANLVQDTLPLLTADTPIIVRMETLRRAAIYSEKDPRVAYELLSRLMARALDTGAGGKSDGLAWFDVGYLVETLKQYKWVFQKQGSWLYTRNPAEGLNGYAWTLKGLHRGADDPGIEFAAALMCDGQQQKERQEHLQKARTGAPAGSLLAKNIDTLFRHSGGTGKDLPAKSVKAQK